jgi:hypothetical protein
MMLFFPCSRRPLRLAKARIFLRPPALDCLLLSGLSTIPGNAGPGPKPSAIAFSAECSLSIRHEKKQPVATSGPARQHHRPATGTHLDSDFQRVCDTILSSFVRGQKGKG